MSVLDFISSVNSSDAEVVGTWCRAAPEPLVRARCGQLGGRHLAPPVLGHWEGTEGN